MLFGLNMLSVSTPYLPLVCHLFSVLMGTSHHSSLEEEVGVPPVQAFIRYCRRTWLHTRQ